jgi:copper homeostasis protein (lipoprotein)
MRLIESRLTVTLAVVLASGCASGMQESEPVRIRLESSKKAKPAARTFGPPATYSGRLPCADCPGIQLTLTLLSDSTFRLRQAYQERPTVLHQLGRWSVDSTRTQLTLQGRPASSYRFRIVGADSLRLLDSQGNPVQSPLNYTLARAAKVDPIRDTMALRGTYVYLADAGRFTECGSGSSYPVAQAGDNANLERAYGESRSEPGAPVLATFRGHFELQPAAEGDKRLEYVVVDSVGQVQAGGACEEPKSNATLENTYWKLIQVGSQAARAAENVPEPHFLLHPAQQQADGSTGCNQFHGPYQLAGDSLRIGPVESTLSACADPDMNGQEAAFLDALSRARSWKVSGDTLMVADETGQLARFVAQYMK